MEKEISRANKNMFFIKTQVLTLENPVYPGQAIKAQVRQSRDLGLSLLTSLHLE
jgi:hypothetical protein